MHDIKFIRDNPELFDLAMQKRGKNILAAEILEMDAKLRQEKTILQGLQNKRNELAKQIAVAKTTGQIINNIFLEAENIKNLIPEVELRVAKFENEMNEILISTPNILADDTPFGTGEYDNILLRHWGEINNFEYLPKQHFELGEALQQMDFKQAAKMSGSRFVILKSDLAKMERVLATFMLDLHASKGYTEITPPYLVNNDAMFGAGQLPKFAADSFLTTDGYRLIPTSEVPLTNLVADSILSEDELPMRVTAYSHCFRSEAGSAGKDTRGMLRQHQFSKVELVSITKPTESKQEHERMLDAAETVLKKLMLPYRVMLLCSQDTGFTALKTYDIEVWLPGQDCYREISSCSNCGDFQSRRMKARYKDNATKQNLYLHTLNGSGLAIGRTIVAILENYQNADGSITVPDVLQSYLGKSKITAIMN